MIPKLTVVGADHCEDRITVFFATPHGLEGPFRASSGGLSLIET